VSLVPSLLHSILQVDGEALVLHVGEKPYVVTPTGQIELATRGLTFEAVSGIVGQLLSAESQRALDEFGASQYELPPSAEFPSEHFTVVAARGGDDVWCEIRRRRVPDDLIPAEIFEREDRTEAVGAGEIKPLEEQGPPSQEQEPAFESVHRGADLHAVAGGPPLESPRFAAPARPADQFGASSVAPPAVREEGKGRDLEEVGAPAMAKPSVVSAPSDEAVTHPAASEAIPEPARPESIPPELAQPESAEKESATMVLGPEVGISATQPARQDTTAQLEDMTLLPEAPSPEAVAHQPAATESHEPVAPAVEAAAPAPPPSAEPEVAIPLEPAKEPGLTPQEPGPAAAAHRFSPPEPPPRMARHVAPEGVAPAPPPPTRPHMLSLERLLRLVATRGASVLYLSTGTPPSMRFEGEVYALEAELPLGSNDIEALLLTLMPQSNQDAFRAGAATEWTCDVKGVGRVRCTTFHDLRGLGGVFRIMPGRVVSAEQLGLSRRLQALAVEPDGLVLVTGPRLSGKRTLISAFVDLINRTRRDYVITVEREITVVHQRMNAFISQREVRDGLDEMLAATQAALREDPDVLVIESLRTPGLVGVALEAASSGRLVIGGFPAHATASAFDRILNAYPPQERPRMQCLLAENLRGPSRRCWCGGLVAAGSPPAKSY
jgi:twitching motility protein PilT